MLNFSWPAVDPSNNVSIDDNSFINSISSYIIHSSIKAWDYTTICAATLCQKIPRKFEPTSRFTTMMNIRPLISAFVAYRTVASLTNYFWTASLFVYSSLAEFACFYLYVFLDKTHRPTFTNMVKSVAVFAVFLTASDTNIGLRVYKTLAIWKLTSPKNFLF